MNASPLPQSLDDLSVIARQIAKGPIDIPVLREAYDKLASMPRGAWTTFDDAFVTTVRETPERQAAWIQAIQEALTKELDALAAHGHEQIAGAVLEWREERDPFNVWRKYHSPSIGPRDDRFVYSWPDLLLRIDRKEGLCALDALPYPWLTNDVLHLRFHDDRAAIEALIEVAPTVFDERGQWVPERHVAALLLVDMVDRKGQPYDSDGEATQAWMERFFSRLLRRSDGLLIALGYLAHLVRRVLGDGRRAALLTHDGKALRTVTSLALDALTNVLRNASVDVSRLREGWRLAEGFAVENEGQRRNRRDVRNSQRDRRSDREGEGCRSLVGSGLPYLAGAATLLEGGAPSETEIERFWSWFEEILVGRDPGLGLAQQAGAAELPPRFGAILLRHPNAVGMLRDTYKALEPQRRRASFGVRYQTIDDRESILVLHVGLYLAVSLSKRGRKAEPLTLFSWIYERARQLWLTAALDIGDSKQQLVTKCFAFMPSLFGDTLPDALRRTIPAIADDPRMLADACQNLHLNGVEPQRLLSLVKAADADLEAALRDARQWSELTGHPKQFPDYLKKLAAELGIDFSQPALLPDSERTARLRDAFGEAVPWGLALLRRLDSDGCSHVRALPLDQEGSGWVVQATLSDALRERFGLSPDIRILAAPGKLQGRILRLAADAPEGAGDVDPDLLVIANQAPDLASRVSRLAGPWGQRVPWAAAEVGFAPLAQALAEHLPSFDIFNRRDPVYGRAFIGRAREVERVTARLLQGEAVGIFGLRKVGKTSLAQAVVQSIDPIAAAIRRRAAIAGEVEVKAIVVPLDVQGLVVRTRDVLAARLHDGLEERLSAGEITIAPALGDKDVSGVIRLIPPRAEAPDADPLEKLRRLLGAALDSPDVPAVCFVVDEYDLLFEGYSGEPGVAGVEQILALLRDMAQSTGRVSLALIGRDPVFAQQPLVNGFTNPLLGWVATLPLGPFSDEDAGELLRRLGRRVGLEIDDATLAHARRWTGGHPLLLREYGSALFEVCNEPRSAPRQEQTIKVFLERDAVHTICEEIEALLSARFPDAAALLHTLVTAADTEAAVILARAGRAAKVLFDFGIVRGVPSAPWVPEVYRYYPVAYVLAS